MLRVFLLQKHKKKQILWMQHFVRRCVCNPAV